MNMEQRLRETMLTTLATVVGIIFFSLLFGSSLELVDAWKYVVVGVVVGAILYRSWPVWKGRRS